MKICMGKAAVFTCLLLAVCCLAGCGSAKETWVETPVTEAQSEIQTQAKAEGWTVTQYGEAAGNQLMFYTITDQNGGLIVIDGGYTADEEKVRKIIAEYGNHVSAWIITHPHPDHAGAFNMIAANPGEIVIDRIYTIDVHYERYSETAEDYDQFDIYEDFLKVVNNLPNVTYVRENDEWECMGLDFKVLHAWEDEVDRLDSNLCNNGSMKFVVSGRQDKMLFCADAESDVQQFIIDRHKEELDVDYVQLGHHGNWGMTEEFYQYTSPRAVFFDAPDWLFKNDQVPYDAPMMKSYFEKQGVQTYQFTTAPNKITIN